MEIMSVVMTTAAGLVGGFGWALLGNAKLFTNPKVKIMEVFKSRKFAKSLVVGAVIGAYAGFQGLELDVTTMETLVAQSTVFTPATAIANKVIDIAHNVLKWAGEKINF